MDVFQTFSGFVVPRWVKAIVGFTLFVLLGVNVTIGLLGVVGPGDRSGWIEAAAYMFGVLLPIFIIVFVVMYADSGPRALKMKAYEYMSKTIPETLASIVEEPAPYYRAEKCRGRSIQSAVKVFSNQYRDSCITHYKIEFLDRLVDEVQMVQSSRGKAKSMISVSASSRQKRSMHVALELNVKKANLVVFIPAAPAEVEAGLIASVNDFDESANGRPFNTSHFDALFPHTLAGAKSEGYSVNPNLSVGRQGKTLSYGIVLIRKLDDHFLTTPQAKLYFAQDLMFMLKSFFNERPNLF